MFPSSSRQLVRIAALAGVALGLATQPASAALAPIVDGTLVDANDVPRKVEAAALLGPTGDRVIVAGWDKRSETNQYWAGPSQGPLTFLAAATGGGISPGSQAAITRPIQPDFTGRYVASTLGGGLYVRVLDTQTGQIRRAAMTRVLKPTILAKLGGRALLPAPGGGFYFVDGRRAASAIGVDGTTRALPIKRDGSKKGFYRGALLVVVSENQQHAAFCQANRQGEPGSVGRLDVARGVIEARTLERGAETDPKRCAISDDGSTVLTSRQQPAGRRVGNIITILRGRQLFEMPTPRAWTDASVSPDGRSALLINNRSATGKVQYLDLTARRIRSVDVAGGCITYGEGLDSRHLSWVSDTTAVIACRTGVFTLSSSGPAQPRSLPQFATKPMGYRISGLTNDRTRAVIEAFTDENNGLVFATDLVSQGPAQLFTGNPVEFGSVTPGPGFVFEQARQSDVVLIAKLGPTYETDGRTGTYTGAAPSALSEPWPELAPLDSQPDEGP